MTDDVLAEIISMPGNDACVDCGARGPRWASVSYGVVMCIQCSGKHRAMGVHLSKVRSLNLDRWDEAMVGAMRCGGNARLASFFASKEEASEGTERYYSRAAALYRMQIESLVAGETPLEELPDDTAAQVDAMREARAAEKRDEGKKPRWVPDDASSTCQVCRRAFTLTRRRHHCRACGKLVCRICAPAANSKPIPAMGYFEPVRHCKACFRSKNVAW